MQPKPRAETSGPLFPSLRFCIYLQGKRQRREGDIAAHIEWLGPTDVTADQALAQKERKGRGRPSEGKLNAAKDFLLRLLRENGEVMPSKQIFEQAKKLGMNESIIYKAKKSARNQG